MQMVDDVSSKPSITAWLLLLGALAEVITSAFVPLFRWRGVVDVTAALLNFSGCFLQGVISAVDTPRRGRFIAPLLRGGFVGVYTSFAFMVEHAAEIDIGAEKGVITAGGAYYILFTIGGSLFFCHIGHRLVQGRHRWLSDLLSRFDTSAVLRKRWFAAIAGFNLSCLLYATFGPPGFVHDVNDPEYLAEDHTQFDDGAELFVGILMSALGLLFGGQLGNLGGVPENQTGICWPTLKGNAAACVFVCLAYLAGNADPALFKQLAFAKFLSSFCGAVSAMGATAGESVDLVHRRRFSAALWNVTANVVLAVCMAQLTSMAMRSAPIIN